MDGVRRVLTAEERISAIEERLGAAEILAGDKRFADGTATKPGIAFRTEDGLGIYRAGIFQMGFSAAGSELLRIGGSSLLGAASVHIQSSGSVRVRTQGTTEALVLHPLDDTNRAAISLRNAAGAYVAEIRTDGDFLAGDGSAGSPSLGFIGDPDTGIFRPSANRMDFSAGGTSIVAINAAGLSILSGNNGIVNIGGSADHPSYTFSGDGDTGMYRSGENQVALSVGGVAGLTVGTSEIAFGGPISIRGATDGAPYLRFDNDTDTGLRRQGTNNARCVAGGSDVAGWNTGGLYTNSTTSGAAANVVLSGGSLATFARSTSARKYKSQITEAPYLADIALVPTKFYRADDEAWYYGLIADDLAEQDSLLGVYDPETGEIENYDHRAVLAVLAAKVNRLERLMAELEAAEAA